MNRARSSAADVQFAGVLLFLSLVAFLVAPLSYGDKTVLVPPTHELDATLASLLVADGGRQAADADPAGFYNTAILYPDRTQLRSTEPFLGYALLALPLRAAGRPATSTCSRWCAGCCCPSRSPTPTCCSGLAGVDAAMSAAGVALCLSPAEPADRDRAPADSQHPVVVSRAVSRPHGLGPDAAPARRPLASVVFVWLAMYTVVRHGQRDRRRIVAALFLLPLLLKTCADLPGARDGCRPSPCR